MAVFLLSPVISKAQYFFAYTDTFGILYVYNDGAIRRMDERRVQDYKFGTQSAAFVDRMDFFKVSFNSTNQQLAQTPPSNFQFSRGMLAFTLSNNLFVYWKEDVTKLSFYSGEYSVHDSVVCFYDRTNAFKVFYDGTIYNINNIPVREYKATRNIVAYNTNAYIFKAFLRGKVKTLEQYEVENYQVGLNTVGYLDQTGRLKVYNSSVVYELEELTPNFYTVADDIVLYHTKNNDFKVFYKDSVYRLETFLPEKYWVQDGLVYYMDENNRLKVFDRGNVHFLEYFLPTGIKVFNHTLLFKNRLNNLMMYRNGEIKNISNEVVNNYWLNGDLIVYQANVSDLVFVGKGDPFRLRYNWQKF